MPCYTVMGCTVQYKAAQLRGCTVIGLLSYGLPTYRAAQIRGCVGTRLRRGYGFAGAAQVRGYNSCEAAQGVAQVLGCTGTGLHTYEAADLRGCTLARLHKYRVAQVRGYTDIYGATQLGATQPFKMGPTQPKINLYSMRKILWPVPDTYTALIQL